MHPAFIKEELATFVSRRKGTGRSHMTVTIMIHRGDDTDRTNAEEISRLVQGIANDESTKVGVEEVILYRTDHPIESLGEE